MVSSGNFLTNNISGRTGGIPEANKMMAAALAAARRNNFSDYSFVDPLNRLLDAYETEADLSAFGRYAVRFDAMRGLKNLLRFDAVEDANPGILSRPIAQPIFITG